MFVTALRPGLLLMIALCGAARAEVAAGFSHQSANRDAFSQAAPALDAVQLRIFNFGNRLFNTNWVVAPASASGFDGLGPTFNRVSCSGCHLRDGRGRPPIDGEVALLSALLRVSIPGVDRHGGPKPVPGYGTQINDRAIPGVAAEAQPRIRWQESDGKYADSTRFSLRTPLISIDKLAYGELPKKVLTSFRVAPAVFGMGLIDGVSDAAILALSDPNDANQDGISGRVNRVHSNHGDAVGRYGWKASIASLSAQNSNAALNDIGITSNAHPKQNCPPPQRACLQAVNGGEPELSDVFAAKLDQYVQMLGVPAPRAQTPQSLRGEALFREFQCGACHVETLTTDAHSSLTYLRDQRFHAYTDLLLHDMGPGLADGRPDFQASGAEWRTAPLWGAGLVSVVNDHNFYLHDGRARGLAEAILWHGGEAFAAKEGFRKAAKAEREALLGFLRTR